MLMMRLVSSVCSLSIFLSFTDSRRSATIPSFTSERPKSMRMPRFRSFEYLDWTKLKNIQKIARFDITVNNPFGMNLANCL